MKKLRKGDLVGRISYGKDIIFEVERIINLKNNNKIVILKGLLERIKADSLIDDLEKIDQQIIKDRIEKFNNRLDNRINNHIISNKDRIKIYTGKILHLDGDKKYSEKSIKYYKKLGLNAIVKHIPENKQSKYIKILLQKYQPDILVITGHDGMIKKGVNYNDIYNYRNSKYFIDSVREARKIKHYGKDLVIFAGACQSFYEALINEGANFASSPARILIDFLDPLIVAEKVATTSSQEFVTIEDFKSELRDGIKGVNGIGAKGKKRVLP